MMHFSISPYLPLQVFESQYLPNYRQLLALFSSKTKFKSSITFLSKWFKPIYYMKLISVLKYAINVSQGNKIGNCICFPFSITLLVVSSWDFQYF